MHSPGSALSNTSSQITFHNGPPFENGCWIRQIDSDSNAPSCGVEKTKKAPKEYLNPHGTCIWAPSENSFPLHPPEG
jgi:hypothetical protein